MSRCLPLLPILLWAAISVTVPASVQDVRLPVFEAGIGDGAGWVPDYPAAGLNHFQGIPFPYAIYRGEILRSDEQGVRGRPGGDLPRRSQRRESSVQARLEFQPGSGPVLVVLPLRADGRIIRWSFRPMCQSALNWDPRSARKRGSDAISMAVIGLLL